MIYGKSMVEMLKKQWQAQFALVLFVILTVFWLLGVNNPNAYQVRYFGDFPSIYGIMALWGGVWGLTIARKWGFWGSVMGKATIMFSLGLFAQELGQIIYAYYSFFQHIAVPYPSLGDVGYFGSIPLYTLGVLYFAKASGVKINWKSITHQVVLLIPLVMLGVGYFLFLQNYSFDWSNPVKIFLDFGYPLGQAIYISLAILTYILSKGVLGGMMRSKILFILLALFIQFLCDYTFLYQSSHGTWSAGGINDYMYLVAYLAMTLGLLQLATIFSKLKS